MRLGLIWAACLAANGVKTWVERRSVERRNRRRRLQAGHARRPNTLQESSTRRARVDMDTTVAGFSLAPYLITPLGRLGGSTAAKSPTQLARDTPRTKLNTAPTL
jgi:hypothetical protein